MVKTFEITNKKRVLVILNSGRNVLEPKSIHLGVRTTHNSKNFAKNEDFSFRMERFVKVKKVALRWDFSGSQIPGI